MKRRGWPAPRRGGPGSLFREGGMFYPETEPVSHTTNLAGARADWQPGGRGGGKNSVHHAGGPPTRVNATKRCHSASVWHSGGRLTCHSDLLGDSDFLLWQIRAGAFRKTTQAYVLSPCFFCPQLRRAMALPCMPWALHGHLILKKISLSPQRHFRDTPLPTGSRRAAQSPTLRSSCWA